MYESTSLLVGAPKRRPVDDTLDVLDSLTQPASRFARWHQVRRENSVADAQQWHHEQQQGLLAYTPMCGETLVKYYFQLLYNEFTRNCSNSKRYVKVHDCPNHTSKTSGTSSHLSATCCHSTTSPKKYLSGLHESIRLCPACVSVQGNGTMA